MSETKVIEENGVRITLIYEIVDEDAFNSLVEKMDYENPGGHPFDDGPTSLPDAQKSYDCWKDAVECPDNCFSLTEVYATQKANRRKLEEYRSGVRKPDPVFLLYEELIPFFEDCYGDINERVEDNSGYFIYDIVAENNEEFSKVIRLVQHGDRMEAFKLMDETIENALA